MNINQEEIVKLLVRHLAVTQPLYRAEITYRTIFGSQISLLKFLNTVSFGTKEDLLSIYINAESRYPEFYSSYSFEQYLQYLHARGLITTQDDEQYFITVAGKEFLKWMTEMSVLENKAF